MKDDFLEPPLSEDDLNWLIHQLKKWPARVDQNSTINVGFLMRTASENLKYLKEIIEGKKVQPHSNRSEPFSDAIPGIYSPDGEYLGLDWNKFYNGCVVNKAIMTKEGYVRWQGDPPI